MSQRNKPSVNTIALIILVLSIIIFSAWIGYELYFAASSDNREDILFHKEIVLSIIQGASLLYLLITLLKTWEMASASRKAAEATEKTVTQMQLARIEEGSPYVVVYLDTPVQGTRLLYLIVKNLGKGIAIDVQIKFDPTLQNSGTLPLNELVLLKDGISSMPPGYEIRAAIDTTSAYFGNKELPLKYNVQVSYSGVQQQERLFVAQTIDLSALKGILWTRRYDIHDLTENFKEFANIQHKLQRSVGSLSDTIERGIFINNPSIAVTNLHVDNNSWETILFAKMKEFQYFWLVSFKKDRENGLNLEQIQSYCLLISAQILVVLSRKPDTVTTEISDAITDIAEKLHETGRMTFYMDGGASLQVFNDIGDKVSNNITSLILSLEHSPKHIEDAED